MSVEMSLARKRGKIKVIEAVARNIGHSVRSIPPFESDKNGFTRQSLAFGACKVYDAKMEYDADDSYTAALDAIKTGRDGAELFACPHCSLCFVNPKRFLIHFKWHFFSIKTVKRGTKLSSKKDRLNKRKVFRCFCSEPFVTTKKLEDHIKMEHGLSETEPKTDLCILMKEKHRLSETLDKSDQSIVMKKNFILENGSIYDLKAEIEQKRIARLEQQKIYQREYRKKETEEQKKIRMEKKRKRLMKETEEERIARLKRHAEKVRLTRKKETEEQVKARKERYLIRMQNESEEKRMARLEKQREYARMRNKQEKQNPPRN